MIYFNSDYTEGAHPAILEKLIQTNMEQTIGYGEDDYSKQAIDAIKKLCGRDDCDVHFLVGGTQTNITVIAAALRPHQGVISASTGHINLHETGGIEAAGHKVLALHSENGKIYAENVKNLCENYRIDTKHEHSVQPKMVYISNPTELGTIYTKKELTDLRKVCNEYNLILYMDGARLGYGIAAPENDLTLKICATMCDAFYIGGTKVGTLFGEALVIANPHIAEDFRSIMKQRGAMLAKGRLLGLQFLTLFEGSLYMDISRYAVNEALRIKKACIEKGFQIFVESPTNQQFIVFPNTAVKKLEEKYILFNWGLFDENHSVIRICTNWATLPENTDKLIADIKSL